MINYLFFMMPKDQIFRAIKSQKKSSLILHLRDQKVFKIYGQVHLLQGDPSDVDMVIR